MWRVYYSPTMSGPFKHVADEWGDSLIEVERAVRYDYSADETPAGFYKLRPEFGGVEFLVEKTDDDWMGR